ncbi:enolase C-terminal domain-like protein [Kribbella sp. NPDC004875]|uniref:enolase C-terminal domain-like protein n=1 Tax=Kribbella sp. NPDC004875 TaxID=3364107 RepID=UPI0036B91DEF
MIDSVRASAYTIPTDAPEAVDANGWYSVGQACRVASRSATYDVTWFEEPVSSDDLAGLRTVRGRLVPT